MPQELNVLCCYSCKMFQVHIVKKAKKWQCKICNEKQSIQRVYFVGSGKECRSIVQQLNSSKQTEPLLETFSTANPDASTSISENTYEDSYETTYEEEEKTKSPKQSSSKWTKYLQPSQETEKLDVLPDNESSGSFFSDRKTVSINNSISENTQNDSFCIETENNSTSTLADKTELQKRNIFDNNEDLDLSLDF